VLTLGFHSPHVEVSDQTFQTLSAGAVLTTEVPYFGHRADSIVPM